MIRIGLHEQEKRDEIVKYAKEHSIESIIVFSPKKFSMDLPDTGDIPIREIEYNEIIMYRTFYPLLGEIGPNHLIVSNEMMRTKNRSDLTYNCFRHYLNQCGHQIIFEYFPFIDQEEDFMILFDFDTKSKYKGTGFNESILGEANVLCKNQHLKFSAVTISLPEEAEQEYKAKKEELFENLGTKNPDTVPRNLHIYCGKWKRAYIEPDKEYIARNSRFKLPNVKTFKDVEEDKHYILLDMMHRRLDMNDYLRKTKDKTIEYITTGLSVDEYYQKELQNWMGRLESFYAQTGIYPGKC